MTDAEFDVAIVGGRVAGGSLALLLARAGKRVVVVDRDAFPSDTLSTHFVSPMAVAVLARLGLVGDILEAGFRKITRHRTYLDECLLEGSAGPGGAFSLAPRRDVLDQMLIDHAVRAGATFMPQRRAERLIERDGAIAGFVATSTDGTHHEIRARVVVGADGKHSKVAEWVGAQRYDAVPAMRPVYYGYYRGVEPLGDTTLEFFCGRDQIALLFPMRPDEDCLALELQPDEFETFRHDPQRRFEERWRALPAMDRRMANARLEGKLLGVKGVENYFRVPYGSGWALTGDAGHCKDPSTAHGIGDALAQAFLLSEALIAHFDGAPWEATMTEFQRRRDEQMKPPYDATLAFTRMRDPLPGETDLLRAVCAMPIVARLLLSALPRHLETMLQPAVLHATRAVAANYGRESTTRRLDAGCDDAASR